MKKFRLILPIAAALATFILSGCGSLGPNSIRSGRNFYNEIIHQTSEDQLLLNIVRLSHNELPLFFEVTEVDTTMQIQTSVSGGPTSIGARAGSAASTAGTISGQVAGITGGVQYQETPTVRYVPLTGAALIAQLSSPLTVESFVDLYDSEWPLEPLMSLLIERMTPGYDDYNIAFDAISILHSNNALYIEACDSEDNNCAPPTKGAGKSQSKGVTTAQATNNAANKNNTLRFFFSPYGSRNDDKNFKCTSGFEPNTDNFIKSSDIAWLTLLEASGQSPKKLSDISKTRIVKASHAELKTITDTILKEKGDIVKGAKGSKGILPDLRTRSALGAMKALVKRGFLEFAPAEEASRLMNEPINTEPCISGNHERLDYAYFDPNRKDHSPNTPIYMLIQTSETPPERAFTTAYYNGRYYFIAEDDRVSKQTMSLLGLITTIQARSDQSAVPPTFPIK